MNFRDVELLSAYLDGQTSPSDSTRLEARLKTDPELASALDALHASRTLLRRMPKRRAPRNFTLTPQMVGRKPPLPRSYPVFRFATVMATVLFALSFLTNQTARLAASAPEAEYGIGGGAATEAPMMAVEPAATEPPATQPPASLDVTESPSPEPTIGVELLVPTATPIAPEDQTRVAVPTIGASEKNGGENVVPPPTSFGIPILWQAGFGAIALLGAASMIVIQRLAARKWRAK